MTPRDLGKLVHVLAEKTQRLVRDVRALRKAVEDLFKRVTDLERGAKK